MSSALIVDLGGVLHQLTVTGTSDAWDAAGVCGSDVPTQLRHWLEREVGCFLQSQDDVGPLPKELDVTDMLLRYARECAPVQPSDDLYKTVDVMNAAMTFVDADIKFGLTSSHMAYGSNEIEHARAAYIAAHQRLVDVVLWLKYRPTQPNG